MRTLVVLLALAAVLSPHATVRGDEEIPAGKHFRGIKLGETLDFDYATGSVGRRDSLVLAQPNDSDHSRDVSIKSLKLEIVQTDSEEEESRMLQSSFAWSVGGWGAKVSNSEARAEASRRRASGSTLYALLDLSDRTILGTGWTESPEASPKLQALEERAKKGEDVTGSFRDQFGTHYVSGIVYGARIAIQCSVTDVGSESKSDVKKDLAIAFSGFGVDASGVRKEHLEAVAKFQNRRVETRAEILTGGMYRYVVDPQGGAPLKQPITIPNLYGIDNVKAFIGKLFGSPDPIFIEQGAIDIIASPVIARVDATKYPQLRAALEGKVGAPDMGKRLTALESYRLVDGGTVWVGHASVLDGAANEHDRGGPRLVVDRTDRVDITVGGTGDEVIAAWYAPADAIYDLGQLHSANVYFKIDGLQSNRVRLVSGTRSGSSNVAVCLRIFALVRPKR